MKEYTEQFFKDWTESSGVREIQHQYDKIRGEADANGTTVQEEMKAKGYANYAEFCAACPRFNLMCKSSQFGELGSGFVLYFHMLTLMMLMFAIFFLMQIYPMVIYSGENYITGWQFSWWVNTYKVSSGVCDCVGYNNGLVGPNGDADYGKTCQAWDVGSCDDTSCSFSNPGKWVCGTWCFVSKECPAPLLEGSDVSLSNRVQVPDSSIVPWDDGYKGLVRSYSSCAQDATIAAQCVARTATNIDRAYSESGGSGIGIVDEGRPNFAEGSAWLSPGNLGPDGLEGSEAMVVSWVYFLCLVVLCALVFLAYQFMVVTDKLLDEDLVLPNDFAVMFEGLPVTATDEKVLMEWFSKNAVRGREVEVVKVVIGWDPGQFAALIKQLKSLKKQLDELEGSGASGLKSYCSCFFPAPEASGDETDVEKEKAEIKRQMAEINKSLASVTSSAEMTSSGVVVVVFRFQEDMRACVKRWNSFYRRWFYVDGLDTRFLPAGNQIWPGDKLPKYPIGTTPLVNVSAVRAPNPGNIHWEELGIPAKIRYQKMLKTNSVMGLIILLCLAITYGLSKAQDAVRDSGETGFGFTLLSILPGLGIGITNAAITIMALKMGQEEYHATWTSENFSQMSKMAFGMLVNTCLVLLIVNTQPMEWYKLGGLVYDVSVFLIITSLVPALIPLVDLGWIFKSRKRSLLTPAKLEEWNEVIRRGKPQSAKMQQDVQKVIREVEGFKMAFTPSELKYTRRFAIALKTFMACMLYMPVSPFVSLIGFFGIFLQYWVDRYVLLKWAKRPSRPIDRELPLYSLKLIKYTVPVFFSLSCFIFLTPSFENKKRDGFDNLWIMLAVSAIYSVVLPFSMWTKPFLNCFVSKSDDETDYYQAQFMWTKEMKYHKDQFLYKKLPESVNPEMLSQDTKAVKMEAMKSSYGAALGAAGVAVAETAEEMKLKGGMKVGRSSMEYGDMTTSAEARAEEGQAEPPLPPPEPVPAPSVIGRPDEAESPEDHESHPLTPTPPPPDATDKGDKGKGKDKDKDKGKGKDKDKDKGKGKDKDKDKDKDKGKDKGKAGRVVWEFRHGDHFSSFQGDCQKFIEERYQAFKYSGGRDHIDRVKSGKITFSIRFAEPMQSKVVCMDGKNVDKPWVDVQRSFR